MHLSPQKPQEMNSLEDGLGLPDLDRTAEEGRGPQDDVGQTQLGETLVETLPDADDPLDSAVHGPVGGRHVAAVAVQQLPVEMALQQAARRLSLVAQVHPAEVLLDGQLDSRPPAGHEIEMSRDKFPSAQMKQETTESLT